MKRQKGSIYLEFPAIRPGYFSAEMLAYASSISFQPIPLYAKAAKNAALLCAPSPTSAASHVV
jgi:hypothetical protein